LLNIIYCELLKLKKSYIIPVAVIGGMFMSILIVLASLVFKEGVQTFEQYSSNLEIPNILLLYTILFSLIAGYVFSREFSDKTSSVVYAYPLSRIKIFIGKLITIDMLISLVYLVEVISIYLGYYILNHTLPESSFIISDIKYNIYSLIAQFLIIPIPIVITNMSKNLILPVIYGIFGTIVTIVSSGKMFQIGEYVPLIAPYKCIEKVYRPNLVDINYSIISAILCFIISMTICIYQYNKDDIV
jgi:ABC-type transport system involved in multi-copper enzyme maturation permease subunit